MKLQSPRLEPLVAHSVAAMSLRRAHVLACACAGTASDAARASTSVRRRRRRCTNDRLQAWLRTEAENVSPAAAAAQVNAASAKAIADAKAFPGVKVATLGYSTQQIAEKGKPTRWRVSQTITVDATDFTAAATLLSKLQDENGLLLSNMSFSVTDKTRRDAEDSVTQQAIKGWQARAEQAAQGLGFAAWRVGHVTRADQRRPAVSRDARAADGHDCGAAGGDRGRHDRRDRHRVG